MSSEYTLGEWLHDWFEIYKRPKLRATAAVPLDVAIRLHVPEKLKTVKLTDLRVIDIDRAISQIPPSRTQKYLYDVLAGALSKAYRLEMIEKDLAKMIEPVRYRVKNGRALSGEEIRRLLDRVRGHKLEYLIWFYLLTGCRRHEALSLYWTDINLERKVILIRGTKTEGSYRLFPLSDDLIRLLACIPGHSERVFPFNDDYVTKMFKRFCPEHKLHDLRHTFATICAERGIHPSVTQKLLGHSKVATTMRVYTHVQTDYISKEFKKFSLTEKMEK